MKNRIPEIQNEPLQIQRLGAQRQLYRVAKRIIAVQMTIAVPISIAVAFGAALKPEWRFGAAAFGIFAVLFDSFALNPWQNKRREMGAKVQEAFDCAVLSLDWNTRRFGRPLDHEEVVKYSASYQKVAAAHPPLTDWYPVRAGEIPLQAARALCQRTNCWWDVEQRRLYVRWLQIIACSALAALLAAAAIRDMTVRECLVGLVSLLPLLKLILSQAKEQEEAMRRLDKVKDEARDLFDRSCDSLDDQSLAAKAREIQDDIFEGRKKNPPIFDWIYKLLRSGYQLRIAATSDQFVDEALRRLAKQ